MVSREKRRGMIEPGHPKLSLSRQCRLLRVSRSSVYHRPKGESAEKLASVEPWNRRGDFAGVIEELPAVAAVHDIRPFRISTGRRNAYDRGALGCT